MTERPVAALDKLILRLPDGMRDRLAARAKANGRSANAEAVFALGKWLDQADWIDASTQGKKVGPWPGITPNPAPADLHMEAPQAIRSVNENSDSGTDVRIIAAPIEGSSDEKSEHESQKLIIDATTFENILGEALHRAMSSSEFAERLAKLEADNRKIFAEADSRQAVYAEDDDFNFLDIDPALLIESNGQDFEVHQDPDEDQLHSTEERTTIINNIKKG